MEFAANEPTIARLAASVGWLVALATSLWAIWKGLLFVGVRLRRVWRVVNGFVNSIEAFDAVNNRLRVIETRLEIQAELSRIPLWRADAHGNCIEANTAFLQLVDLTMEEAKGAGWYAATHPADRQYLMTQWLRAVADVTDFNLTFRLRSDVDTIKVIARAKPVRVGGTVEFHGSTVVLNRKTKTAEE